MSKDACPNSQVPFGMQLYKALIEDISAGRPPFVRSSLLRDLRTIRKRMEQEGIQFCTIALPSLSKAIRLSFITGQFVCPSSFRTAKGTSLPRLFSGLMKEIYSDDGALLDTPDIASLTEVYQLCELGYKLDIPCDSRKSDQVIRSFVELEDEFSSFLPTFPHHHPILELARSMIAAIFKGFDPFDIYPRHGPGAVATGEKGPDKMKFKRKYSKLHRVYGYYNYFVVSPNHVRDKLTWYKSLKNESESVARVILVPKDSRGPRLISMEPLEIQYMQQGLWRAMKARLEGHPITREHVNFTSQGINRACAFVGSITGFWATLDMKDASDRVTTTLVESLFADNRKLLRCLLATRSSSTSLPDGRTVALHKFAPMGSAVCFPVESIVHYVLSVASICYTHGLPWWRASRLVYVYGDDLITTAEYADCVVKCLPLFGLKFNEGKCFIHGKFRESCGMDAFSGHQITPIRWRKPWPLRLTAGTASSFADMASLLYQRGYYRAAEIVWLGLEKELGKLPTFHLRLRCSCLRRISFLKYLHSPNKIRYNEGLQRLEHKALVIRNVDSEYTEECGWATLLRFVTTGAGLTRHVSPFVYTKKVWTELL